VDGQSTPVKVTLSERTVCSSVIESTVFLLLLNILMVESGHQVNSTLLVLCVLELRVRDTRVCDLLRTGPRTIAKNIYKRLK
jgi:hypothetical protein